METCARFVRRGVRGATLVAAVVLYCAALPPARAADPDTAPFAIVDGVPVGTAEFERALAETVRAKYYHRKPPEGELDTVRREVADALIDRVLLLGEARRRGIAPDRPRVEATVAGYEQRYAQSEQWRASREVLLPRLVERLEQDSRLAQLESAVRSVVDPGSAELRAYYASHPSLFTEPEQVRLSVILLRVDPSSPRIARESAQREADAIVRRLRAGADFAELARVHSGDAGSAPKGGDMGYLHRGMLPQALHAQLDKLTPGGLSDPVELLEGVAIFRLEDRRAERLRDFDEVQARIADLWRRERAQNQWNALIAGLRQGADIEIRGSLSVAAGMAALPGGTRP